jgi:hypothetical protein
MSTRRTALALFFLSLFGYSFPVLLDPGMPGRLLHVV